MSAEEFTPAVPSTGMAMALLQRRLRTLMNPAKRNTLEYGSRCKLEVLEAVQQFGAVQQMRHTLEIHIIVLESHIFCT